MKTYAFVHFTTSKDAEKARLELNGVKIAPKYALKKISRPVRLCKYETKQTVSRMKVDDQKKSNLLAKNISKEVSAHQLWNMFRAYGDIVSCKLVIDLLGNSKGYAFINFYRSDDAEKARNELDERELNGKIMRVAFLETGRRKQPTKNNVYVKHFPKTNFDNDDLKVNI
jgi:polyadenylate-binding protein